MPKNDKAEGIKIFFVFFITGLLILNGLLAFLRPVILKSDGTSILQNLPFGTRLFALALGIVVSWWVTRVVYRALFTREVEVDDALNVAYTLFFYVLLTFATFSFVGLLPEFWFLFPLLFLILFFASLISLWNFLGGRLLAGSFIVAAAVVLGAWFWTRTNHLPAPVTQEENQDSSSEKATTEEPTSDPE